MRSSSLAVKFSVLLAAVVVAAVAAAIVLGNLAARREFQTYVSVSQEARVRALVPILAAFYEEHDDWEGLDDVISAASRGRGMMMGENARLIVADENSRVVYDSQNGLVGRRITAAQRRQAATVNVGDDVVGYLLAGSGPQEQQFTRQLNLVLIGAGALAGIAAMILGLVLTGAILRPLEAVTAAARRLGHGDLTSRAPVSSDDEIGDLARDFNEMAASVERTERERRTLTADIAHELRNPLAVMRGQVEALQDGIFPLTVENLAPIRDGVLLLSRLVDDLRDLALAEAGRLPMERSPIRLEGVVERAAAAFAARARARRQILSTDVADGLPQVSADVQRMDQVLGNLLSNAIRHAPEGGHVTIRAWVDGARACMAVIDDGAGIEPAELPHLFERFYRTDRARARSDGGTGLGLAIAKQIVEAHGGEITVASRPGEGTTFTVCLPPLSP